MFASGTAHGMTKNKIVKEHRTFDERWFVFSHFKTIVSVDGVDHIYDNM